MRKDQSTINRKIGIWARKEGMKLLIKNHKEEWQQLQKKLKYNHPKYKRMVLHAPGLPGVTKSRILKYLQTNPNTPTKELCNNLKILKGTIYQHLNELKRSKKIKHTKFGKNYLWSLK